MKLSQKALAKMLPGTTQQRVHRLEVGETQLEIGDLPKLADALKCEPAEVVGYDLLFRDKQKIRLLAAFDAMDADDRARLIKIADAMAPAAAPAIDMTAVERGVEDELAARGASYTQDEKDELIAQAAQHLLDLLEREGVSGLRDIAARRLNRR